MTAASKLRWFRFSLRGLFVVVTVAAIVFVICRPVTVEERNPRFPSIANHLPEAVAHMGPRYVDISWSTRAPTIREMTVRLAFVSSVFLAALAAIGIYRVVKPRSIGAAAR
jgi:hypothetical protein